MFERNIVDLVGLFIENVQSLYPFPDDPPWGGHTGLLCRQRHEGRSACILNKRQRKVKLLHKLSRIQISGVPSRRPPAESPSCPRPLPPGP